MTTPTSVENPLKQLTRFGQSIWLDYIQRRVEAHDRAGWLGGDDFEPLDF
jgi:hypothetical protein